MSRYGEIHRATWQGLSRLREVPGSSLCTRLNLKVQFNLFQSGSQMLNSDVRYFVSGLIRSSFHPPLNASDESKSLDNHITPCTHLSHLPVFLQVAALRESIRVLNKVREARTPG